MRPIAVGGACGGLLCLVVALAGHRGRTWQEPDLTCFVLLPFVLGGLVGAALVWAIRASHAPGGSRPGMLLARGLLGGVAGLLLSVLAIFLYGWLAGRPYRDTNMLLAYIGPYLGLAAFALGATGGVVFGWKSRRNAAIPGER